MCKFGRSSAASMISAALAMRLFTGLTVDFPVAHNAAWMCPLLGFGIFLPLLFSIRQCDCIGKDSPWENVSRALPVLVKRIFQWVFALVLAYDAASVLRLTASSSNIIALGDDTVHLLVVPLGITIAAAILLGGDALGDSARISLRLLPLLMVIVILVQLGEYRFGWLTPVLGSGFAEILRGSIYCAGCMALLSLGWMIAVPGRGKTSLLRCFLLPAIGVSILLIMHAMSAPAMPQTQFTRAARIELVLSNGRMSLYPQFVLNILWYGGLLYLLATECVSAAAFLHISFPGLKRWLLATGTAAVVSAAAIFNPAWLKCSSAMTCTLYPVLAVLLALPMLLQMFAFRRNNA